MTRDFPHRIVNIGSPTASRNSRRTSWRRDFQIHILNNDAHDKFTPIARVTLTPIYHARMISAKAEGEDRWPCHSQEA
jgi:hypothetical protein